MNEYRGKHASSQPWAVSSTATVPIRRARHMRRKKHRRFLALFIAAVLVLLLAYPLIEARILTVDEKKVKSADLPQEADQLRIIYLSDIHWGFWYTDGDLNRLLSRINSLRPDLVLFGGDYATDYESALRFFRRLQSTTRIHARYGVYGVLGETDYLTPEGSDPADPVLLSEAMSNADIVPLVNKTASVYFDSSRIILAGADDYSAGSINLKAVASSVTPADFVIFLCHNPAVIPEAQQTLDGSGSLGWFDLGLFGHTHGGQMTGFSSLLGLADDVPNRYLSGWLTENRVDLLVSRGVGTSVFPGRLFCFPQIHLIQLEAD